jgi:hypothetical protein
MILDASTPNTRICCTRPRSTTICPYPHTNALTDPNISTHANTRIGVSTTTYIDTLRYTNTTTKTSMATSIGINISAYIGSNASTNFSTYTHTSTNIRICIATKTNITTTS